jgi:D-alanyl-D-alanine carboxypeptidase/D-alanyl-D-alanine-endopeptidase (penicillin-binding protein 4)
VLNDIHSQAFYKHANLGVSVRDVSNGHLIASLSKDKMMIPASTLKIITTMTAKKILGDGFKFETHLKYDGELAGDGTLHGNIYIQGNGDPTLGAGRIPNNKDLKDLESQMLSDIRRAGILCIEGDIIAIVNDDESMPISESWQWNDLGNYYATGSWSINVNENLYNVYYNRNFPLGTSAKISYIEPYIPNLTIKSYVTIDSAHTADNSFIFGAPFTYQRMVRGTLPQGKNLFKIKGAIPDPPLFLAYRLYTALGQMHISESKYKTELKDNIVTEYKPIAKYYSPTLTEIIQYTNDMSINLYADALLEQIGKAKNIKGNAEILKSNLRNQGIDVTPLHIEDGSGLSPRNLLSPDLMALFLSMQMTTISEKDIPNLLPTVGVRGTVKTLLNKSSAKGKMWVKSGSMDKILTYAGYCRTASGKLVSFSVMLNGSTAKSMKENKIELEKILDAIYRFS